MKITFNINFFTVWGQSLYITGSIPELGSWEVCEAKAMEYKGDGNWSLVIDLPEKTAGFEYRYFLKTNDKLMFEEWNTNHSLTISGASKSYFLLDYWQTRPQNLAYYSSAFIKSLFAHPCNKFERVVKSGKKLLIKILAPHVGNTQSLAIIGNQKELGNWDVSKALILSCDKFPLWSVELDAGKLVYPLEYKFLIVNDSDKSVACWESGENRVLDNLPLEKNSMGVVSGLRFRDTSFDYKCAGLVIPVFSLRSSNSFGIGDFADLKEMVNWAKLTSQKIVQVLPINDTTITHTWIDSYPYNAVSVYALHPLYLSLQRIGTLNNKERADFYAQKQQELNKLNAVDYELVSQVKWAFFREIYEQDGKETLTSDEFLRFFEQNRNWLIPYAAFSYLRDKTGTVDFSQWGEHAKYNKSAIEKLTSKTAENYSEIAFYYFLQYHLDKQLAEVRNYAYSNGIVLKGDVPIGVSRTSVDVWTDPQYFNLDCSAGAPPDDFSVTGQNWFFPTYNWEEMERDDYEWWKRRFRKMSDYFDAYRIDHILGFFRIWEISEQYIQGLCGTFSPALPLSVGEIENAGFHFNKEWVTIPHINEYFLPELFGDQASEACNTFLQRFSANYFILKEKFDTQSKVRTYFAGKDDPKSIQLRDGLYKILEEVLFIPDKKESGKYHPRISAMNSYMYRELNNSDKYAFDYLYWNFFYQRHNDFWKEQGYKHLTPLISSTNMMVCGEDLGMIPQSIPEVMHKLQIFSLEIERMPKEVNMEFANLRNLPYMSVCTSSTHDMSTIRGWWREDRGKIQRYYNQVLHRFGEAPEDCSPDLCEQILRNHLWAPSMLVIIPFQDWLSIDGNVRNWDVDFERINQPVNPRHYWRYRMHLGIEDLIANEDLNGKIKNMIESSGRS
ncbi:MAG: 4-alpha-glucanotransferase [Candidatus Azobacteroides sp.]|nr:4-alpha-glucanotransferase [Candidatus Azobacteroides sp.]